MKYINLKNVSVVYLFLYVEVKVRIVFIRFGEGWLLGKGRKKGGWFWIVDVICIYRILLIIKIYI